MSGAPPGRACTTCTGRRSAAASRSPATIAEVLSRDHDVTLLGRRSGRCRRWPASGSASTSRAAGTGTSPTTSTRRRRASTSTCSSTAPIAAGPSTAARSAGTTCTSRRSRRGRGDRLRHQLGLAGVKALSVPPRLPERLVQVRAGFERRVQRTDLRPDLPALPRQLPLHVRVGASGCGACRPRCSTHPCAPSVEPGEKQPTDPQRRTVLRPALRALQEAARADRRLQAAALPGWELALAGGCDGANREYFLAARRAAIGQPIAVHVNATGEHVRRLLAEASIYWHAGGFGEDPERHPERFEHFGIAVVEAMAAGAVPLVFAAGGPAEIVQDGVNGCHWRTLDELVTPDHAADRRPGRAPSTRRGRRSSGRLTSPSSGSRPPWPACCRRPSAGSSG